MPRSDNLHELPPNITIPTDDGACDHLPGIKLPALELPSTTGRMITLANLPGRSVVYIYPRTGRPDEEPPLGWNEIPGARGCTPQSCSFRDHYRELQTLGADVFGLSTQGPDYQREAAERLHLPFELLSDEHLSFARVMHLPTFEVEGMILIKRITLILNAGVIEKVFYPVFPPHKNAEEVIEWLSENLHHEGTQRYMKES